MNKRVAKLAPIMHEAYLRCARDIAWPIRPEVDMPFEEMSDDAKAIDFAIAESVLKYVDAEGGAAQ